MLTLFGIIMKKANVEHKKMGLALAFFYKNEAILTAFIIAFYKNCILDFYNFNFGLLQNLCCFTSFFGFFQSEFGGMKFFRRGKIFSAYPIFIFNL